MNVISVIFFTITILQQITNIVAVTATNSAAATATACCMLSLLLLPLAVVATTATTVTACRHTLQLPLLMIPLQPALHHDLTISSHVVGLAPIPFIYIFHSPT